VSVNSERYINILKKFKDLLQRRVNIMEAKWLCQDGASPHVSHLSLQWLRDNFGDHVISLKTGFVWAQYSSDLNNCDYFLLGHLKDTVYRDVPQTIDDLKRWIIQNTRVVNQDKALCQRVIENFKKRIQTCSDRRGRHLEHILYHVGGKCYCEDGFILFLL